MDSLGTLIGKWITYHGKGQRAERGQVTAVSDQTFYGRTVYVVTAETPSIGSEQVSADRIISILKGSELCDLGYEHPADRRRRSRNRKPEQQHG